jgi:hypothetical protein
MVPSCRQIIYEHGSHCRCSPVQATENSYLQNSNRVPRGRTALQHAFRKYVSQPADGASLSIVRYEIALRICVFKTENHAAFRKPMKKVDAWKNGRHNTFIDECNPASLMKHFVLRAAPGFGLATVLAACGSGTQVDPPPRTAAMTSTAAANTPAPDCAADGCKGLRIIDANAEAYRYEAMRRAAAEAPQS